MRGRKTFKKPGKFGKLGIGASPPPPPPCTFGEAWTVGGKGVRGVLYDRLSRCNWVASPGFVVEYGSSQIDLSIRGQIEKVAESITASTMAKLA